MNPSKEILNSFERLKLNFSKSSESWKSNGKLNVKALLKKEYQLNINELMNFYIEILQHKENISLILKGNIDLLCWNLLTERVSLVIKYPIDPKHLGKNSEMIIQSLYSVLLGEMRDSFIFFKNVYKTAINYQLEKDLSIFIFIANVLTFMGDLKKLKLMFNKKFEEFKEYLEIEGDTNKDANDSISFFNYSLINNPRNTRVYSNLGYVYREFLEDHLSSAYWFIRALSCIDNDMKKLKENLEKDFNYIRKQIQKKDYVVDSSLAFFKYDLDYLPILFYRIIGILFKNIDVDDMERLSKNFEIITKKIMLNYHLIPDQIKINYEEKGQIDQMIIMAIFSLHYQLNNLEPYPTNPEKIILPKQNQKLLSFGIFDHHLVSKHLSNSEIKPIVKLAFSFITLFTQIICKNITETNYTFFEKYLLLLFYWLSLNYDIFQLIITDEIQPYLKFLNFSLQNDIHIKQFFHPKTKPTFDMLIDKINRQILPTELTFLGFIPMHRFFELNPKQYSYRTEEGSIQELAIINKFILIHFLNEFGLTPQNNESIALKFHKRNTIIVQEKIVNSQQKDSSIIDIQSRLSKNMIKLPGYLKIKKERPLVILDASNIAMRHGNHSFSCKGIQIVIDYFTKVGHQVTSFLPDYLFKDKDTGKNEYRKKRPMPDNIEYLKELKDKGQVIQSPPQDYDDSYCIQYAKTHNGYIVTNDLFRDYVDKFNDSRKKESERMWIKEKCISYTFNKDEFLPNPDAAFFKEFDIKDYNIINN